jgi:hypothetical protein
VGGKQRYWPQRTWRKAVRIVEEGLRMAQCSFGLAKEGRERVRFGKRGGLGVDGELISEVGVDELSWLDGEREEGWRE